MEAACSGADVVTAQAFETMAWLISPPVVGVVGSVLLMFAGLRLFAWIEQSTRG